MSFDTISKYTFPKAGAARARALVNNAIARSDLAKQLAITLEDVDEFFSKNKAYLPPGGEKTVNIPCILGYTGISQLTLFEAIKQKSLISSPKTALVYAIISKYLVPILGGFEVRGFEDFFAPISKKYEKKILVMNAHWVTFVRKLFVPEGCVLHDTIQEDEIIDDTAFIERVQEQSVRKAYQHAGTRLAVDRNLFEASAEYLESGNRKFITDILKDKSYEYFNMSTKQIANRKKMYDVYQKILENPQAFLDDDEEYSLGTIALDTGSPPFYGYELSGLMLHPQMERAKTRVAEVRQKAQQRPRTVGTLAQAGDFSERFKKSAVIGPSKIIEPKAPVKENPKEDEPKKFSPEEGKGPGPTSKPGPVGFISFDEVNNLFGKIHGDALQAKGAGGIHIAWNDDVNHRNLKECESSPNIFKDAEFYALKCSCLPIPKNFSSLTIDQVNILLKYRGAVDDTGDNIRMLTKGEASMFLFSSDNPDWRNPEEEAVREREDGSRYEYMSPQATYISAIH